MNLSQKVAQTLKKDQLVAASDLLLVGVSGGADSVCLLLILSQLRTQLGFKLQVAHFNHQLRASADRDEAFVRTLTGNLGLPLSVARAKKQKNNAKVSEDTARRWRLDFLTKTARNIKAQALVLAHNQNDLAETVLMRIIRGSGLMGLRGILPDNTINGVRVIRPLLAIQRSEIEEYMKQNKHPYKTDETNLKDLYLRNKIRLRLLPLLLKEYNPNLTNVLVDLAATSAGDYDYLVQQAQLFLEKLAKCTPIRVSFSLKKFLLEPEAIQRMVLRLSYRHLTKDLEQLAYVHIKEVEALLSTMDRKGTARIHWPRSIQVSCSKKILAMELSA